ncbi:MAG: hypothetical protein FJ257_00095 [Phycisphaerae bacterium]|nr:hypothetical protein [Phycisphaerae bacterium]
MDAATLRKALRELDGHRDLRIEFDAKTCRVSKALLIPEEPDGLVKVTDGARVFVLDATGIRWIEIG